VGDASGVVKVGLGAVMLPTFQLFPPIVFYAHILVSVIDV
jgi:hypothetical protein